VVTLRADEVSVLSHRRAQVVARLETLQEARSAFVEQVSGREAMRLSDFVEQACALVDKKRVMTLVRKMKDVLQAVEEKSREFTQVLNFSLGLVNGEISLLWSASQPVTRVYNAFGSVQEAVQPGAPRVGSLLGEA
jgi:excinuclease UvrABC nuclease subunit